MFAKRSVPSDGNTGCFNAYPFQVDVETPVRNRNHVNMLVYMYMIQLWVSISARSLPGLAFAGCGDFSQAWRKVRPRLHMYEVRHAVPQKTLCSNIDKDFLKKNQQVNLFKYNLFKICLIFLKYFSD